NPALADAIFLDIGFLGTIEPYADVALDKGCIVMRTLGISGEAIRGRVGHDSNSQEKCGLIGNGLRVACLFLRPPTPMAELEAYARLFHAFRSGADIAMTPTKIAVVAVALACLAPLSVFSAPAPAVVGTATEIPGVVKGGSPIQRIIQGYKGLDDPIG